MRLISQLVQGSRSRKVQDTHHTRTPGNTMTSATMLHGYGRDRHRHGQLPFGQRGAP